MPSVRFYNADIKSKVANKTVLKRFIPFLFAEEKQTLQSLSVIFCSDNYVLELNKKFLNHDYYTDILTFDLNHSDKIIGEIYISIERVEENSFIQKVSFQEEIERIIFHGVLHLCGYRDKSVSEKFIMTEKENEALVKYRKFHVKQ